MFCLLRSGTKQAPNCTSIATTGKYIGQNVAATFAECQENFVEEGFGSIAQVEFVIAETDVVTRSNRGDGRFHSLRYPATYGD